MKHCSERPPPAEAAGFSASTITRLIEQWQAQYQEFSQRDLSEKCYVYLWADGIYFNVRLADDRPCLLVLIGATVDGRKEFVAISDGQRESAMSWKELLLDIKHRGLSIAPELAIADGALGFWGAIEEVFPSTRQQRCWVHKTANVLNKLPKKYHSAAKRKLHEIYESPRRKEAELRIDEFGKLYDAGYPKAYASLRKDLEQLLCFYEFPAEHWRHIRSTNVIESAFAPVRHRTR